jgi:hypothetical protein
MGLLGEGKFTGPSTPPLFHSKIQSCRKNLLRDTKFVAIIELRHFLSLDVAINA